MLASATSPVVLVAALAHVTAPQLPRLFIADVDIVSSVELGLQMQSCSQSKQCRSPMMSDQGLVLTHLCQ